MSLKNRDIVLKVDDLRPLQDLSKFLTNCITWISNIYHSLFYWESYAFSMTKTVIQSLRYNFLKGSKTPLFCSIIDYFLCGTVFAESSISPLSLT